MPLADYANSSNTLTAGAKYTVHACIQCATRFEKDEYEFSSDEFCSEECQDEYKREADHE